VRSAWAFHVPPFDVHHSQRDRRGAGSRIALPSGAVFEAALEDLTRADT
jgi:hypothetical protein